MLNFISLVRSIVQLANYDSCRCKQTLPEELRLRTCHIAGLAEDTDPESIRRPATFFRCLVGGFKDSDLRFSEKF